MERLGLGLRQAARRLRHEWRFTCSVVVILGLGIGPAAAMVSLVERVLLRPLAYHEPDQVGIIRVSLGQLLLHPGLTMAEGIDFRNAGLFDAVEVAQRVNDVSYGPADNQVSLKLISMTTGMLPMLGVSPVVGRLFSEDDIPPPLPPPPPPVPGAPPPPLPVFPTQRMLLDFDTWQTHFGGDTGVLGRVIRVDDFSYEVIGVLPRGFRLVTGRSIPQRIDFYTPFRLQYNRGSWFNTTLVRVKKDSTFEHTQQGLNVLAASLQKEFAANYRAGSLHFTLAPALDDMTRTTKPALRAAAGAVLLMLVIAFANVSALVVARLRTRDTELAVKTALGASRRALILDLFLESLVLGLLGAAVGALIGVISVAAIREVIPRTVPRWDEIRVGWDLLIYAAGVAVLGFVGAGLMPAWRIARGTLIHAIRSGSAQGGKAESAGSRLVLVGAQIALTVVMAFSCVQLARSAAALSRVDLGYDANVLTFAVPFEFRNFRTNADRALLYQRLRDRIKQVPGVTDVGVVSNAPLSGLTMMAGYETDLSKVPNFDPSANYQGVTPGYFAAMKIPILQGRDFTDQEDATGQSVIIVDEMLARQAFPGKATVIGETLRLGWGGLGNARIVGVVGHARTIEVGRAVRPQVYAPRGNLFIPVPIVAVRGDGDIRARQTHIIEAIRDVGPGRAITPLGMLTDNVTAATSTLMAVTGLVTFLALFAGLLSAFGLYLVLSFIVFHRRRSTAIRTALGASRGQVIWHHSRTSAMVLLAALPVGVALSVAATPMFADLIFGVAARDVSSLAIAVGVAVLTSVVGTLRPVLRASDTNVVAILRGE
jgi:putative ABC transport system permease protein